MSSPYDHMVAAIAPFVGQRITRAEDDVLAGDAASETYNLAIQGQGSFWLGETVDHDALMQRLKLCFSLPGATDAQRWKLLDTWLQRRIDEYAA